MSLVAERVVLLNPEDLTIRTMLQKATNILKILKAADEKAFWEYADDFLPFLKEARDEQ